jgi:hypothetical protein
MTLHDRQKLDDNLGRGPDKYLALSTTLGVVDIILNGLLVLTCNAQHGNTPSNHSMKELLANKQLKDAK